MKDIIVADESALQKNLDVEKWLKSELAGKDLCGTESFCAYCDKSLKNPCAKAVLKQNAEKADKNYIIRYRRSFTASLIQNEGAQKYYSDIKNALLNIGLSPRISFKYESFRYHGKLVARLAVHGKSLTLFLIRPQNLPENLRYADVSTVKAYSDVPLKIKLTSARSIKNTLATVEIIAEELNTERVKRLNKEYKFPYRTDPELLEKGLIKPYRTKVRVKA